VRAAGEVARERVDFFGTPAKKNFSGPEKSAAGGALRTWAGPRVGDPTRGGPPPNGARYTAPGAPVGALRSSVSAVPRARRHRLVS